MSINLRSFTILSAAILLAVLVAFSYMVLKQPDEEWVMVESGKRIVCKQCGKLMSGEIEVKKVKSKDKMKYRVKTIRDLCGICAMKELGIETGSEYLFKKIKVRSSDRVEIYSVNMKDPDVVSSLRATISKEDIEFKQIIKGIAKSKTGGIVVRTIPDVTLRWYKNKNKLIETKYCLIDRRLEVRIEEYPSECYVIFLPKETGEIIQASPK